MTTWTKMSDADRNAISAAMDMLYHNATDYYRLVLDRVVDIVFEPKACEPGAASCTGGTLGATVSFAQHPAKMTTLEAACLLVHEALHHDPDTGVLVQHAFSGRPTKSQMDADPIYSEVDRVRAILKRANAQRARHPAQKPAPRRR